MKVILLLFAVFLLVTNELGIRAQRFSYETVYVMAVVALVGALVITDLERRP